MVAESRLGVYTRVTHVAIIESSDSLDAGTTIELL